MKSKEQLLVYISSPFAYKDIFDVFYKTFCKHWKCKKYRLILSTNYNAQYEGLQIFNSQMNGDDWVNRSINCISQLKNKYILLLCDDLFLCKDIIDKKIDVALDFMHENNIKYFRLKPIKRGQAITGTDYLYLNKRTPYGINLQRGIFEREFLLRVLGNGEKSAWDIEKEWLQASLSAKDEYYSDVIGCKRDIVPVIHGVQKGKWIPKSIRELKKDGIEFEVSREVMTTKEAVELGLKEYISEFIDIKLRYKLKRLLKKTGISFTSDY